MNTRFTRFTRFTHLRIVSFLGGFLVLCCLLHACASSRLLKAPTPINTPDLDWAAAAPDGLKLVVDEVIIRNTGGSWVRNANWDEYVLTMTNDSMTSLEIVGFNLYSELLPAPEESSMSGDQLEARTNTSLRALKDTGIIAGTGLASAGVAAAVVGPGGAYGLAGAAAAIVVFPIALIGGASYVVSRHHRAKEDKVLIERNLMERGFALPVQLAPGIQLRKSVFFPITPAPTRIVVRYAVHGEAQELPLNLPALAGLHLKTPRSANTPNDSTEATHY